MKDTIHLIVVQIKKTIELNILTLTNYKNNLLVNLEMQWLNVCNHLFETLMFWDGFALDIKQTRFNLQKFEYNHMKQMSGLQSQIVIDAIKDCFSAYHETNGMVGCASPSFNIPRSGNFKTTKHGNPVISIATNGERIALPISQDGGYYRFQQFIKDGWKTTNFRLKHIGGTWKLLVVIHKEFPIADEYDAIIGIDVGSRTLASISILKKDKIIKQLYLGRNVLDKQRDIGIQRSELQSYAYKGNRKALKKLGVLKRYESDFIKTRCYEIAHQVIKIAKQYNACIAIEDLNKLNEDRLGRKSNRRVKRMPYRKFRVALEQIATENGIRVIAVNPRYTSQLCSCCGNLHKTSDILYRCPVCGYTANRDRNASVNIARIAGIFCCTTIKPQISTGNAPVNRHVWKQDGELSSCRRHSCSPDFKSTDSHVDN